MISFENDYLEGAHEKVLARLIETNMVQESGYGTDSYTKQAQERIKEVIGLPTAEVQLLTGGTQTNQIVIDNHIKAYLQQIQDISVLMKRERLNLRVKKY